MVANASGLERVTMPRAFGSSGTPAPFTDVIIARLPTNRKEPRFAGTGTGKYAVALSAGVKDLLSRLRARRGPDESAVHAGTAIVIVMTPRWDD